MSGRVEGKRILVTGASSGIGRAVVELLVREGAHVVFCSANREKGERAAAEIGMGVGYRQCDVRSEEAIAEFIRSGVETLGGWMCLFRMRGFSITGMWKHSLRKTGTTSCAPTSGSVFLGAKYAVPHLKAAGGGCIINTSSVAGKRGGRA